MSNESSDACKIRRAPSGKFYASDYGDVVCLPNGSLRYFGTEREALPFLAERDAPEISRIAA